MEKITNNRGGLPNPDKTSRNNIDRKQYETPERGGPVRIETLDRNIDDDDELEIV